MNKHTPDFTPGPWDATRPFKQWSVTSRDGRTVCDMPIHMSTDRRRDAEMQLEPEGQRIEANARLIAAAPDLLAALDETICGACHDMIGLPPANNPKDYRCGTCADARRALAAARGQA